MTSSSSSLSLPLLRMMTSLSSGGVGCRRCRAASACPCACCCCCCCCCAGCAVLGPAAPEALWLLPRRPSWMVRGGMGSARGACLAPVLAAAPAVAGMGSRWAQRKTLNLTIVHGLWTMCCLACTGGSIEVGPGGLRSATAAKQHQGPGTLSAATCLQRQRSMQKVCHWQVHKSVCATGS
jgi:hypothetical protein